MYRVFTVAAVLLLLGLCIGAQAVVMETVTVGDAGNVADPPIGNGSVAYVYNIGKYEVTTAQYTDFRTVLRVPKRQGKIGPLWAVQH